MMSSPSHNAVWHTPGWVCLVSVSCLQVHCQKHGAKWTPCNNCWTCELLTTRLVFERSSLQRTGILQESRLLCAFIRHLKQEYHCMENIGGFLSKFSIFSMFNPILLWKAFIMHWKLPARLLCLAKKYSASACLDFILALQVRICSPDGGAWMLQEFKHKSFDGDIAFMGRSWSIPCSPSDASRSQPGEPSLLPQCKELVMQPSSQRCGAWVLYTGDFRASCHAFWPVTQDAHTAVKQYSSFRVHTKWQHRSTILAKHAQNVGKQLPWVLNDVGPHEHYS